jgi:hypothetical protein
VVRPTLVRSSHRSGDRRRAGRGRTPVGFEGDPVTFWIVPWTQILAAFALLALLATILLASRDRRREWRARRREERAVLRDHRARRDAARAEPDPSDHQPVG